MNDEELINILERNLFHQNPTFKRFIKETIRLARKDEYSKYEPELQLLREIQQNNSNALKEIINEKVELRAKIEQLETVFDGLCRKSQVLALLDTPLSNEEIEDADKTFCGATSVRGIDHDVGGKDKTASSGQIHKIQGSPAQSQKAIGELGTTTLDRNISEKQA